jgi:hypothetical protein
VVEGAARSQINKVGLWVGLQLDPFFMKALSVIFLTFILSVIVLADAGSLPPFIRALYRFPYGDKVGHFVLFGLLNFFLTLAFNFSQPNPRRKLAAVSTGLILALFIALEEWSQQFFSARTFDLRDLLASWMGALLGGWAAWKIKRGCAKKHTPQNFFE